MDILVRAGSPMKVKSRLLLRRTFRAGIALKGADGLLETFGGVLLWFVKPSSMSGAVRVLLQHELSEDPHDWIATHLLHASQNLATGTPLFASVYLASHGLVKIVLAVALWFNRLWAYPFAILVFGAFSLYQVYRYTHTHSQVLLWLTLFDAAIIYLIWKEYGVVKSYRTAEQRKKNSASTAQPLK
jgi:uncharacterized membrane protein